MAAFLEDPRLRQRWNQISHNAEAVTENAAAGIWTFQQSYINPCLASLGEAFDSCTAPCLGDREDRARRQRERARGAHRSRAEYSFDFYDDWYDDFDEGGDQYQSTSAEEERGGGGGGGGGGLFGSWRARTADWDRLLAGSGSKRNRGGHHDGVDEDDENAGEPPGEGGGGTSTGDGVDGSGEVTDQPRRGRGMSYSTRAMRRKHPQEDDPTVIPSTAPLGFLSRLPWKIGGTLRYKPSAANLREHPNSSGGGGGSGGSLQQNSMGGRRLGGGADMMRARDENEPLLGGSNDDDYQDGAGTGTGSRRGLLSWQNELEAADASRQYGTALSSVPAVGGGRPSTRGTVDVHDIYDEHGTPTTRKRSGTTSSGDTSNSFRSRGDLFPSDEEDDEDAVPLDDEFAVALNHVDDRSSGRTRFSSSSSLAATGAIEQQHQQQQQRKGKKRADTGASIMSGVPTAGAGPAGPAKGVLSRSVSRTTIDSVAVGSLPRSPPSSITKRLSSMSLPLGEAFDEAVDEGDEAHEGEAVEQPQTVELTTEQLRKEDERAAREEDEAIEKRREAAARLARERGLAEAESNELNESATADEVDETDKTVNETDKTVDTLDTTSTNVTTDTTGPTPAYSPYTLSSKEAREAEFVPARLPRFD